MSVDEGLGHGQAELRNLCAQGSVFAFTFGSDLMNVESFSSLFNEIVELGKELHKWDLRVTEL